MIPDYNNTMEVSVQIQVRQPNYGNGALSLTHQFSIRADSFADIANILRKYDELSKSIEATNKKPER